MEIAKSKATKKTVNDSTQAAKEAELASSVGSEITNKKIETPKSRVPKRLRADDDAEDIVLLGNSVAGEGST